MVKLQEVYETLAQVGAQECTDLHFVIFEARVDGDLIKALHGRPVWIRMPAGVVCNCYKVAGLALKVLR